MHQVFFDDINAEKDATANSLTHQRLLMRYLIADASVCRVGVYIALLCLQPIASILSFVSPLELSQSAISYGISAICVYRQNRTGTESSFLIRKKQKYII